MQSQTLLVISFHRPSATREFKNKLGRSCHPVHCGGLPTSIFKKCGVKGM